MTLNDSQWYLMLIVNVDSSWYMLYRYIFTYVQIYTHTCIFIYTYLSIYLSIYIYIYIHDYMYIIHIYYMWAECLLRHGGSPSWSKFNSIDDFWRRPPMVKETLHMGFWGLFDEDKHIKTIITTIIAPILMVNWEFWCCQAGYMVDLFLYIVTSAKNLLIFFFCYGGIVKKPFPSSEQQEASGRRHRRRWRGDPLGNRVFFEA